MLFDDKDRTREGPIRPGESEFAYYDTSARPPYVFYRALLNGWINRLPAAERANMVTRFRNESYAATLAELVVHEALRQQGHTPEVHPVGAHPTRRLDYVIKNAAQNAIAYIEVTSINPTREWAARNNREAAIYNAIDEVNLPAGWRLGYAVERHGQTSPNLNQLKAQIEQWSAGQKNSEPDADLTRIFDASDWQIELRLFGGFDLAVAQERAIVTAMGELRRLTPDRSIRQALQLKGSRYGELNAPYLIVVADNKDELAGGERNTDALLDAVFGSVVTRFTRQDDGRMVGREERQHNGYWGVNGNPIHRGVSGVLLLPRPSLWYLRDERWQPIIVRNPWATHPLPDNLFALPSFGFSEAGEIVATEGGAFADLIGLPEQWPPDG